MWILERGGHLETSAGCKRFIVLINARYIKDNYSYYGLNNNYEVTATVVYEIPDGVTCPLSNPDLLYALQVVVSALSSRGSFLKYSFSALSGFLFCIYCTYEIHE